MADETVCWQCGRPVARGTEPASGGTAQELWQEASRELKLSPQLVYGGATLLVVVGLLLVTAFLGSQPRLQAARTDLPAGWAWVNGPSNDFTLFLPGTWQIVIPSGDNQQAALNDLVGSTPYLQSAYRPLGILDEELDTVFYAEGQIPNERETAFLLVGRSRLLNQLGAGETIAVAESSAPGLNMTVRDAYLIEQPEKSHVYFDLQMGEELRCQQQFIRGKLEALLVTVCTRPEARYQETAKAILDSFQRLDP